MIFERSGAQRYFKTMGTSLNDRLNKLAESFGTLFVNEQASVQRGEHVIWMRQRKQKQNIQYLEFSIPATGLPPMLLRSENRTDRLGKLLGLNREFHTGDPEFDTSVYIETGLPDEAVDRTLAGAPFRLAVQLILNAGAKRLEASAEGLSLRLQGKPLRELDEPRCVEFMDGLALALTGLPRFEPGTLPPERKAPGIPAIVAASILILLGSVGLAIAATNYEPLDAAPFGAGLMAGLVVLVVLIPFLGRHLRGYSNSFRRFLIVSGLLLVGLSLSGMGLAVGLNGALDASPPAIHSVSVLRGYTTRGKNTTFYHLELQSWRSGEPYIHLKVSSALYHSRPAGTQVVLCTQAGFFDWEWLVSYQ